uniref:Uncharacterized protein n=1 Tax=Acrobeloides nanus TaxID=290746 RepID=A0A914DGZ8_9BILA
MTKRKYRESYERYFTDIKRSKKGEYYVYCILCNDDISLAMTEKTAISIHQKTEKHKKATAAMMHLQSSFLVPVSNAFVEGIFSLCFAQWTDKKFSKSGEDQRLSSSKSQLRSLMF